MKKRKSIPPTAADKKEHNKPTKSKKPKVERKVEDPNAPAVQMLELCCERARVKLQKAAEVGELKREYKSVTLEPIKDHGEPKTEPKTDWISAHCNLRWDPQLTFDENVKQNNLPMIADWYTAKSGHNLPPSGNIRLPFQSEMNHCYLHAEEISKTISSWQFFYWLSVPD